MLKKSLLIILIGFFTNTLHAQGVFTINIYFNFGSYNLSAEEQNKLKAFVKSLDTLIIKEVSIFAYCDDMGSDEYNQQLSLKRALQIREALTQLKVEGKFIKNPEGKGELPLLEHGDIEEMRALNRKAEIKVSYEIKAKQKEKEKGIKKALVNEIVLSDTLEVGDKIILQSILFVGGYSEILPESFPALNSLTKTLKEKKQYNIIILGHICCLRPGQDGQDFETGLFNLSEVRARRIYDYLIEHGINAKRLDYKGLKSDFPTGKGDKFDRRVEIEISSVTNK